MGFWIFMLIMDALVPLIMLTVGLAFCRAAPKNINPLLGYRTTLSMKNQETWAFAHRHCGTLWRRIGAVMLPLSALPLLFVIGENTDRVGTVGSVVCLAQVVILIGSLIPTECALRKHFDPDGNPRKSE